MSTLDRALWLQAQGCSVIPLEPRDKRPCAELLPRIDGTPTWRPYQSRIATPEEIESWFAKKPDINIGLVCGAISGVVCVDVDGEQGQAWFKNNMPAPNLFQYTSSAHKFHAFFRHPGNSIVIPPSVRGIANEIDIRGDGSYCVFAPSVHPSGAVYDLRPLDGFDGMDSLVPCPDVAFPKEKSSPVTTPMASITMQGNIPEGERDSTITSFCARWYAKGLSTDEISLLAHGLNAAKCKPALPAAQVDKIVRSIGKTHANGHPLSLNTGGLQAWLDLQGDGTFSVSDIFQQLGVHAQGDKDKILLGLKTLKDNGIIEQAGRSTSIFRKIKKNLRHIDLDQSEVGSVIPFQFLFGLENNLLLRQKNIVVIAGESNAGKTAFLFNLVFLNGLQHKFRYITSEMTSDEINERIKKFSTSKEEFSQYCTFFECTHDYADAIDPEGINIIDFLEIYEDFSKIGLEIKKIFDRLTTGVAFIAIQKKQGALYGRGGEFTLEKARLAISLYTHGHLQDGVVGSAKITKCKNFIPGKNPDHQEIFYVLEHGYYYNAFLDGVFSPKDRFFNEETRKTMIDHIQDYCKKEQTHTVTQVYDAYGNLVQL